MFPALALLGGGLALGGIGSMAGANAQNRAAAESAAGQRVESDAARARLGMMMFGPEDYNDFMTATGPEFIPQVRGGGLFSRPRVDYIDNRSAVNAARQRFFSKYRPLQEVIPELNNKYIADLEGVEGMRRRNTDRLDRMGAESEGAARDFEESTIARTAANLERSRKGADQQATASLAMLGPSSLLANQLAGNRQQEADSLADRTVDIRNRGLAAWQGARGSRLAMLGGRLADMEAGAGRLADSRYRAAREPVDMQGALFSGGAFQPYTPMASSAGQSGIGSMFGSLGQALTGLGGMGLMGGFGGGMGGGGVAASAVSPAAASGGFNTSLMLRPSLI